MEAFASLYTADFLETAATDLRERYPEKWAEWGDGKSLGIVRIKTAKAKSHGISLRPDVFSFLCLVFELGPDFDTSPDCPWIPDVLNDNELSGKSKIALIRHRLAQTNA
jgi:hypothetical protein